jgi:hypothetical protein
MTDVSIKGLVPSFVISDRNRGMELLLQGGNFAALKAQKIDIVIESGGGVRWMVDEVMSKPIELEGETFFIINAVPIKGSFREGGREYTDLKITLKIGNKTVATQSFKVLYSDPIIG